MLLMGVTITPSLFAQQPKAPQVKYSEYKLKNGLRVVLSVDHSAPVVAVSVT